MSGAILTARKTPVEVGAGQPAGSLSFRIMETLKSPAPYLGVLGIVALDRDGHYGVFFGSHAIASIDLTKPKSVGHLPEQPSAISPG